MDWHFNDDYYYQKYLSGHSLGVYRNSLAVQPVHAMLSPFIDCSVKEIMDELRETHPEEAMLLGEYIVQNDADS